MNKKLLYILLLFSIIFNFSFLSLFIYRTWIEKPPMPFLPNERGPRSFQERKEERPPFKKEDWRRFHEMKESLKPDLNILLNEIRKERRALAQLILTEKTDSLLIDAKLKQINRIQNEIEHVITFHILKQKEMLPDSLKTIFVNSIMNRYKHMNPRHHGPDADRRHRNPKPDTF